MDLSKSIGSGAIQILGIGSGALLVRSVHRLRAYMTTEGSPPPNFHAIW